MVQLSHREAAERDGKSWHWVKRYCLECAPVLTGGAGRVAVGHNMHLGARVIMAAGVP